MQLCVVWLSTISSGIGLIVSYFKHWRLSWSKSKMCNSVDISAFLSSPTTQLPNAIFISNCLGYQISKWSCMSRHRNSATVIKSVEKLNNLFGAGSRFPGQLVCKPQRQVKTALGDKNNLSPFQFMTFNKHLVQYHICNSEYKTRQKQQLVLTLLCNQLHCDCVSLIQAVVCGFVWLHHTVRDSSFFSIPPSTDPTCRQVNRTQWTLLMDNS